jgi:hypothetical protein
MIFSILNIIFIYYYIGMIKYIILNNTNIAIKLKYNKESINKPVIDEWNEFIYEFHNNKFNIYNIIMEFFDFIHSYLRMIVLSYFSNNKYNIILWYIVYILSLPVSIKLAYREYNYKCIRNHKNKTNTHNCPIEWKV